MSWSAERPHPARWLALQVLAVHLFVHPSSNSFAHPCAHEQEPNPRTLFSNYLPWSVTCSNAIVLEGHLNDRQAFAFASNTPPVQPQLCSSLACRILAGRISVRVLAGPCQVPSFSVTHVVIVPPSLQLPMRPLSLPPSSPVSHTCHNTSMRLSPGPCSCKE
jgi:hypothetical protein